MNSSSLQKIKEQLEAEEKQEFRNMMKNKLKERTDTKALPKFAKVNNKNVIECQICHFSTKDQLTFLNHVPTKKHQAAVEQLNKLQAQAQAKARQQVQLAESQGSMNVKRKAPYDLEVENLKDDDEKDQTVKPSAKQGSALVSYQDEDDDEDQIPGPVLGPKPKINSSDGNQGSKIMEIQDSKEEHKGDERMIEDKGIASQKEKMVVEKPAGLPAGFFDKEDNLEDMRRKVEIEKTMQNYKQFIEEIKKTNTEDPDEILKELQGDQPPLGEDEQEILNKVIKQDEEEIEDAHSYINNLRKRIAGKGKTGSQMEVVDDKGKGGVKREKMESENDEGAGFSWKKKSLF